MVYPRIEGDTLSIYPLRSETFHEPEFSVSASIVRYIYRGEDAFSWAYTRARTHTHSGWNSRIIIEVESVMPLTISRWLDFDKLRAICIDHCHAVHVSERQSLVCSVATVTLRDLSRESVQVSWNRGIRRQIRSESFEWSG